MTHDFLSAYPAKLMEYGLAISYLLLFIPFWRFVQGGKRAGDRASATASRRASPPSRSAPRGAPCRCSRPSTAPSSP